MSTAPTLLPDLLWQRATDEPERIAYILLDEHGAEADSLTYRDLHRRALAVAEQLRTHCVPGDRALLIFPQRLEFIVAYFGCLYARVLAVPVPPPRRTEIRESTRSIIRDCRPTVVLTMHAMVDALRPQLESLGATSASADPQREPDVSRPESGVVPLESDRALPERVLRAGRRQSPEWLAVDRLPATQRGAVAVVEANSLAFLQYTSGSTSTPKGVMVSHGNLAANLEMIKDAFGHDRDSTMVGWTPLFHDQGLIGNVLQPLYIGATGVLMSPSAFIRRPLLWLSAITRYRAHTSGGPNFAFDACVARAGAGDTADLDLSCWQVAFNGAEPLRPQTLRNFAETFAPHGFQARSNYPCYGLAEATLLVSGSVKGRGPRTIEVDTAALERGRHAPAGAPLDRGRTAISSGDARAATSSSHAPAARSAVRTLVGSGRTLPGEDVRIVDPHTHRLCPPDHIGEIWVSGDHVAQGYWGRIEETSRTFQAVCTDLSGRRYLRTGDLGVVVDGELYVTGRAKDLLIIRGRNHYPQDIEHTVTTAHHALRSGGCAAFADGEKLVIIQEIRRDQLADADAADVSGAIRAAVLREHDLSIGELVLTTPGLLPKTSSGKLMRAATRNQYRQGAFEPLPTAGS
ncbi:fatty acyl-AMP ligase [Nocardia sp. NPDC056000]|uniref:fatty acyl-AMP ligase n=1 Tax=Nocardia sp. NPDC056000 TaxID=3345674 RepID=UPI0035DAC32A